MSSIIVVIVVVAVIRRRKRAADSKAKLQKAQEGMDEQGRPIVAFENPMYDAPIKSGGEPTYADTAAVSSSKGLYDEPAFSGKSDKDNPMYESTENLAEQVYENADHDDKSAGYNEVSPTRAHVTLSDYADEEFEGDDFFKNDGYMDIGGANQEDIDDAELEPESEF